MTARLRGGVDVETGEVVFAGDALAFGALTRKLRAPRPLVVRLEPCWGWAMVRPLAILRIAPGGGLPTVRVSEDQVTLAGGVEATAALADEIEAFVEHNDLAAPGMHAHISDGVGPSGHRVLAPGSCDLILAGSPQNELV